jgi:glycosyltransferase involved in cell wall biosynthesis
MQSKRSSILVAAVMITGKSPEHEAMARVAVQCFLAQSYQNKKLIIINDGDYELGVKHPLVIEHRIEPGKKLGELRNIGIQKARDIGASWVIQWDDDDFHHQHRILYQMAHRVDDGDHYSVAVVLKKQMRVSLTKGDAFNIEDANGIAGTILHNLQQTGGGTGFGYPDEEKGEDAEFMGKFDDLVIIDNHSEVWPGPALYVRLYHGGNTWDEEHVMGGRGSFTDKWRMNRDELSYLQSVMRQT